ncbi:uncharacterized protein LOC123349360 isoform X1 [Mauremys mutica]|uniref:uncharacterized protein LOC123349360 isoform X1 n=1 Tax=Mauremys mutica TaxID=74926 RepID=UPI001D161940|nr:uncharacterized protein LOC123349360 isoform X1 [Mauremys mutica]
MWSCSFAACLIRRLLPCEEDIAQAHLGFTSKMNEDDKPRCSKQQDEGEHTRQPHNYCSQTNPLLTQENELHAISKTRSSLIVSSSQLPFLYNTIYKSDVCVSAACSRNAFVNNLTKGPVRIKEKKSQSWAVKKRHGPSLPSKSSDSVPLKSRSTHKTAQRKMNRTYGAFYQSSLLFLQLSQHPTNRK